MIKKALFLLTWGQKKSRFVLFFILLMTFLPVWGDAQEVKNRSEIQTVLKKPDLFLILLDSLRADEIDRKVNDQPVMPRLSQWAKKNIIFTQAQSSSSSTPTSVSAMFTSLPVIAFKGSFSRMIPKNAPVLAEVLSRNGYHCLGYSANPNCRSGLGHDRGFDLFEAAYANKKLATGKRIRKDHVARIVNPDTLIEKIWKDLNPPSSKPVFVYIHLLQPHAPYTPPSPHGEMFLEPEMPQVDLELKALASLDMRQKVDRTWFPALRAHYDGHCHWVDKVVGDFLERIEEHPRFSRAGIVLLSDHGEAFGEHNRILHNSTVYEAMIRIPLILKFPGLSASPEKVDVPVDLIDVAPTFCSFAEVEPPAIFQGVNLTTVIQDPTSFERRPLLSKSLGTPQNSLRYGEHKIIRRKIKSKYQDYLFNWREDPGEIHDLAQKDADLFQNLLKIFNLELNRYQMMEIKSGSKSRINKEEADILRSLGYVDSDKSD